MTGAPSELDEAAVRDLLRAQHPDLADRPLRPGPEGWDNQMWRLGEDLAVRLPSANEAAEELLLKEYAWLPALPALPLPVPVPQRLSRPSEAFPRAWIVTTWVPGTPADLEPPTRAAEAAGALAGFLTELHRPAPAEAPAGRGRGGSLGECEECVLAGLALATERGLLSDPDAVREVWADAVAAPEWTGPRVWLHADLHPANVLTADGTLCGVVDFGDLCAGDPACDLAAAWVLLPDGGVERFRGAYGHPLGDATLRRARGWAVWRALGGLLVGDAGVHGRPGGKPSWGPPARLVLHRLTAGAS